MNINYHDAIHETYNIDLRTRQVIVLIADIDPDQSPGLKGVDPRNIDMRKLEDHAEIIFKTCLQPCMAERLQMNNFLTLVIGTDDADDTPTHHEELWNRMRAAFHKSVNSISNILGLRLRIAVSSVHRNIGNVYDAYWETHAIIEHFTFLEQAKDMITVDDIMSEACPAEDVRLSMEKQWFSYTAAYQFGEARRQLKQIVSSKMSSMRTAVTIKTELFSRMNYMVYFVCDCNGVNHSVRAELQNKIQTLWAIHGKDAVFDWIDQIYLAIEQVITMNQNDIVWSERIISFIRNNYMDPQLDVNTISRRFGLNAAYVSHVFRQSTGIRLLDYIHNVRIEHISRLLTQTDLKMSEIAKDTGYADPQSMCRVYKRYMKTSPTAYRKNHKMQSGLSHH